MSAGVRHCASPNGAMITAAPMADISCIEAGDSVAAMRRVRMLKLAYINALPMDSSRAGWKAPVQGRMMSSTPPSPAAMASQRLASRRSPNHQALSSAISSGTENWMAPVSANCRYCSAQKFSAVITPSMPPRSACSRTSWTRSSSRPYTGASNAEAMKTCDTNRIHTTWNTGRSFTSHLAQVSSRAKSRVVRQTSVMPMRRLGALSS